MYIHSYIKIGLNILKQYNMYVDKNLVDKYDIENNL